jgi:hypothetical protein
MREGRYQDGSNMLGKISRKEGRVWEEIEEEDEL